LATIDNQFLLPHAWHHVQKYSSGLAFDFLNKQLREAVQRQ